GRGELADVPGSEAGELDGPGGGRRGPAHGARGHQGLGETAHVIPATIDLNLQSVRRHFPALSLRIDGRPVVYLDNPAGTQVPQRVIDRTVAYWQTINANHGGVFATSERSDALILEVRAAAAALANAAPPE